MSIATLAAGLFAALQLAGWLDGGKSEAAPRVAAQSTVASSPTDSDSAAVVLESDLIPRLRLAWSLKNANPKPAPIPTPASSMQNPALIPTLEPTPPALTKIERTPKPTALAEHTGQQYREATLKVSQGQIDAAINGLQAVLREAPGHTASRQLLIKLLIEQWQPDEAEMILRQGLQQLPGESNWISTLARLQMDRGAAEEALETLRPGLAVAADRADFQALFGNTLQHLNRHREALEHFVAATRLAPEEGRWWVGRGLSEEALGMSKEARGSWETAKMTATLPSDLSTFVKQRLQR